jgi:NhaA family Na+:H+ antiporter
MTFSLLSLRLRIEIPISDLSWRLLAGGGMLAGIGFTMALFMPI